MASERLQVILELVSGQYKREAAAAATATGAIGKQAGVVTTATGRMKDGLAGFAVSAKFFLAGAAGAAVTGFAKDSVRAFSELEQAVGGTEAVFGDHAGAVEEMAARSAKALGLSEAEFRTATTSIGGQLKRLTGDVGFAAEQSVALTQVAADLAATYGGTTAEAVQALGAAFRGEADPAERFNLDLKVSKVNLKAVELGLAANTREVNDYAKAKATIALIEEQAADAMGQFGRESDTTAGQLQRLSAQWENFKARIGEEIVPVVIEATQAGSNLLDVFDEDVNLGWTQRLSAGLQTILGESSESVEAYIKQKDAQNDLADSAENLADVALMNVAGGFGAARDEVGSADDAMKNMAQRGGKEAKNILNEIGEQARSATPSIHDMADAVLAVNDAMLEAADPIFAAQQALQRYEDMLEEVSEDGKITAEEQLALAEAALEANAKLAAVGAGDTTAGLQAIADALGISYGAAQDLVEQLGILDGTEVNLLFSASMPAADRALLNHVSSVTKTSSPAVTTISGGGGSGGVQTRAAGGPVSAGRPYLVGERGPEMFVPNMSGSIIPNGAGGGPTYIFHGDVYGDEAFMRKVREANVQNGRLGLN